MRKAHNQSMKNNKFLRSAILLSIANSLLVAVGVLVLPSLVLATLWALGALVLHFVLLVTVAHYELMAEFAPRQKDRVIRLESKNLR